MKTRFAITHTHTFKGGHVVRILSRPNQARFHWDSAKEAQDWLDEIVTNTPDKKLVEAFGIEFLDSARVDVVHCFDTGDSTRTIFPTTKPPHEPTF